MDTFDDALDDMCKAIEALDDMSEEENACSEDALQDQTYVESEFLQQFALIVGREDNIPLCIVYAVSQLNHWFYDVMSPLLRKKYAIYCKYAPRLARAEHRRLIANPVEYTGTSLRIMPILGLQGHGGGLLLLNSDPPIFSDEFLADRRPALVNICLLTNKPVSFFYKLGFRTCGILRSGYVKSTDYVVLPPYTEEELERARDQDLDEIPVETIMPGRYFVDLGLELDINPVLFAEGLFHIDDLLLLTAYHLMWHDTGSHLEPSLIPNVKVILDNFTHIIAQFVTVPVGLLEEDTYSTNLKDARKFSVLSRRSAHPQDMRDILNSSQTLDFIGPRADDLLDECSE
jgi:hypothetical protein